MEILDQAEYDLDTGSAQPGILDECVLCRGLVNVGRYDGFKISQMCRPIMLF